MVFDWENETTEDEEAVVEILEEAPVQKASSWRSKAPQSDSGDSVQVEYTGSGSYSILGYTFSSKNSTQSIPSHIASLVIATGKFKKK